MGDETDNPAFGNELHNRLISGDPTASAEIAEIFLPLLIKSLLYRFPALSDPHWVETAVEDSILSYLKQPFRFDPNQATLKSYLFMSAWGDILNIIHKELKTGLIKKFEFVELDAPATEYTEEGEGEALTLDETIGDGSLTIEERMLILESPVWPLLESLLPKQADKEIALLMLEGIRRTATYSQVLGIQHLVKSDQKAEVKRHKDRIKKTLQRHIQRNDLGES